MAVGPRHCEECRIEDRHCDERSDTNRHCEPTGRANARPMTGSAKQSIAPRKRRMDCFVACAPRNDVAPISKTRLRVLAARYARGLQEPSAQRIRGRRECRAPNAPADGVTGSPGAFQASRASYGAVCGARRAACLEGRRSSLTLMV